MRKPMISDTRAPLCTAVVSKSSITVAPQSAVGASRRACISVGDRNRAWVGRSRFTGTASVALDDRQGGEVVVRGVAEE